LGIMTLMWMCLASAWNIFGGYTGQVSLGHAMFFGMGAYGAGLPFYYWNVTPWIGIFIGVALSIILALLVALPIFKLSAQYFAIATLALGETVRIIAVNLPITQGMRGIDILNFRVNPFYSLQFRIKLPYYYMYLFILLLVFAVMLFINCTKAGYYFRTIKANQTAAESIGIDSRKYKTIALVISAIICSLCGSLYLQYLFYVDPGTVFVGTVSTRMIIMAVIGGLATIQGPIIGALILVPLSEFTRVYFGSDIPGLDFVIYAVLVMLIVIYQPQGLVSFGKVVTKYFKKFTKRRNAGADL